MATNYYKTNIHQQSLRRRHSFGSCPPHSTATAATSAALPTCSFSKNNVQPNNNISVTSSSSGFSHLLPTTSLTFSKNNNVTPTTNLSSKGFSHLIVHSLSLSSSTSTSSRPASVSFDTLEQHLSAKDFRQADEETRRLLIVLAGEAAEKRGYVFFSEVKFISDSDLKTIDSLWLKHSDNRFGYSVQKRVWKKVNRDFTRLFIKLGWMKKLDTEIEQYNYRSFPSEFIWELDDDTPEGHLPLTNALRGTQLLNCVLNHPAFKTEEDEESEAEGIDGEGKEEIVSSSRLLKNKSVFKTDYSF